MRKRILLISLTLSLILAVGCGNEDTNNLGSTEKIKETEYEIGVSPYKLSAENKDLLKTLALEEANILSFNAPRTVKNIKANIYTLEDGTWKKIEQLSKDIEDRYFDSDDVLKGSFSMIVDDVNTEKMTIKLSSSIRSLKMDRDGQLDGKGYAGDFITSNVFLEEFKNIELNKEIPVAIMVKNQGGEINSYNINSFFDTDNFEGMYYVEAVTLNFED